MAVSSGACDAPRAGLIRAVPFVDGEITEDTNGDDIRSELRIVDGAKAITQVGFGGGVCRYCGSVP